jgi:hypothetical protein
MLLNFERSAVSNQLSAFDFFATFEKSFAALAVKNVRLNRQGAKKARRAQRLS